MRIAVINAIIGHCDNRLRALQQRECTVHLISRQTMGWLRTDYIVSEGRDALGIPWSIVLLTAIKVTNNLNCKSKANFASLCICNTCKVKDNVSVKKIQGELHHNLSSIEVNYANLLMIKTKCMLLLITFSKYIREWLSFYFFFVIIMWLIKNPVL